MIELLPQIAGKWKEDREGVSGIGDQVVDETQKRLIAKLKGQVSEQTLEKAYRIYATTFDGEYGGFGDAPKFPTSHNLSFFLIRYYKKTGETHALNMVEKTLDSMNRGGMYDHIGFGFARYSTDGQWLVPHFEKMLYDNALLAMTYVEAYQVTGKKEVRRRGGANLYLRA